MGLARKTELLQKLVKYRGGAASVPHNIRIVGRSDITHAALPRRDKLMY